MNIVEPASDMAIALGARLNQLRAAALPKRAAEPCGYCGRTDCEERFDHDRLDRGHEVTYWRKAVK